MKFDSDFESGNLDLAALTFADRDDEYDLILRLDSNCRGHQQWYYFSVSSQNKRGFKGKKVRFNILNFTKPRSLYSQGMQPVVWSDHQNKTNQIGWQRGGDNITYYRGRLKRLGYKNPCYCLSFEYTFTGDNDTVYFAYSIPYTFTMLTNFLSQI